MGLSLFRKRDRDGSLSGERLERRINELTREDRVERSAERERSILGLRHRAALEAIATSGGSPDYPQARAFAGAGAIPEIQREDLTPEGIRAAILGSGCVLVPGLIDVAEAQRLRGEMDRAFDAMDGSLEDPSGAYWSHFPADPKFDLSDREWMASRASAWAVDSPRVMVDLFDTFDRTGLRDVIAGYLGERPAISVNKCTLRRVYPEDFPGEGISQWHQDGAFLGDVRALNVWLTLSRCGDVSPGLDIVPKRLDEILPTGTEGATYDWSVANDVVDRVAGEIGIVRPVFNPGDVLLFDELLLHGTAIDTQMQEVRYAVECWFFGPSAFPEGYAPVAA